jgi:hypothetical protein
MVKVSPKEIVPYLNEQGRLTKEGVTNFLVDRKVLVRQEPPYGPAVIIKSGVKSEYLDYLGAIEWAEHTLYTQRKNSLLGKMGTDAKTETKPDYEDIAF